MNNAQCRRRRKLGPVCRAGKPVEVIADEPVDGGAGVHVGVGEGDSGVEYGVSCFEGVADFV